MRGILLNWMCEVCTEMRFQRQTYHMAVTTLDVYFSLTHEEVSVSEYQTLGAASLAIAAKCEEI